MLRDAEDYFGEPVMRGIWQGGAVKVRVPGGSPERRSSLPNPLIREKTVEFAALVVLSGEAIDMSGRGASPR